MPYITAFANDQMQNVFTPLSMGVHFTFCVLSTIIYLLQYSRKGSAHYLLIMIAIDLTFLTQINTDAWMINFLFVAEVVLLLSALAISIRNGKNAPKAKDVKTTHPDVPDVETEHPDAPEAPDVPDAPDIPDTPDAEEDEEE